MWWLAIILIGDLFPMTCRSRFAENKFGFLELAIIPRVPGVCLALVSVVPGQVVDPDLTWPGLAW